MKLRQPRFFLAVLSLFIFCLPSFAGEKVSFSTREGKKLVGEWTPPTRENQGVLICLHGLQSTKAEWAPLVERAAKDGWGVLAYDARGHGESSSTHDKNGTATELFRFGPPRKGSPWEKMIDDAGASVQFVKKELGEKTPPIFLVGASLGANVALNFASYSRSVKGVVLLSPGLDYQGVRADKPLGRLTTKIPLLIVVSPADQYAHHSSVSMKEYFSSLDLWTDVPPGHGVQMFDEKLLSRLMAWLEKQK